MPLHHKTAGIAAGLLLAGLGAAAPAAAAPSEVRHVVIQTGEQQRETWSTGEAIHTVIRHRGRIVEDSLTTAERTLVWSASTGRIERRAGAGARMGHSEPEADLAGRLAAGDLVDAGEADVPAGRGRVLEKRSDRATWRYVVRPGDLGLLQASVIDPGGRVMVSSDFLVNETLPATAATLARLDLLQKGTAGASARRAKPSRSRAARRAARR